MNFVNTYCRIAASWLVIFDGVHEQVMLTECWPAGKHGAVLVTTRNVYIATYLIDLGLQVDGFRKDDGAAFLFQATNRRETTDDELEVARELAKEVGGLPLALNRISGWIIAHQSSFSKFSAIYAKHRRRLHEQRIWGSTAPGYDHTCLLYTSPSPRDGLLSRMPSSA